MIKKETIQSVLLSAVVTSGLICACYYTATHLGDYLVRIMWFILALVIPIGYGFSSYSWMPQKALAPKPSNVWVLVSVLAVLMAWALGAGCVLMISGLVQRVLYEGNLSLNFNVAWMLSIYMVIVLAFMLFVYQKAKVSSFMHHLIRGALGALVVLFSLSAICISLATWLQAVSWRF